MALVTGPMASVIFKLGKLLNEEYKLQTGVRKKIRTLTRDLESMHASLRKVSKVPPNELDDEVKLWVRDVRELSYNVEDILDTFLVHLERHDEDPDPNKLKRGANKIGKLFSKSKARHKIARMIETINEQAEEVAERHRRYRADDILAKPATTSTFDPRLSAMFREVSQLVGIDKSRDKLISMLSSSEEDDDGLSNKKLKIVSIVGDGGLGKTTLAKVLGHLHLLYPKTHLIRLHRRHPPRAGPSELRSPTLLYPALSGKYRHRREEGINTQREERRDSIHHDHYTRFRKARGAMEPNMKLLLDQFAQLNQRFDAQDVRFSNLERSITDRASAVDLRLEVMEAAHSSTSAAISKRLSALESAPPVYVNPSFAAVAALLFRLAKILTCRKCSGTF